MEENKDKAEINLNLFHGGALVVVTRGGRKRYHHNVTRSSLTRLEAYLNHVYTENVWLDSIGHVWISYDIDTTRPAYWRQPLTA